MLSKISCLCLLSRLVASLAAQPVDVAPAVLSEKITRNTLTGSINSLRLASLSSRTDGLVESVKVEPGDTVAKGDVLIQLDARRAELALEAVRVEKQRAQLALAEAERRVEEVRALTDAGGFSRSETETRINTADLARNQIALLETRELEQLDLLDRHRLPAPFAGVISQKLTEAGEWVSTGIPVLELIETSALVFEVRAPQEMFARSAEASDVALVLDAYPSNKFPAEIDRRVPAKDGASRTFLIRLRFTDPGKLAAHGMSGTATFVFREAEKSIQVPRDAIVRQPDGSAKVWRITEDASGQSIARSILVTPGSSLESNITITGGISEGDLVVIRGNEALRDGQSVTVKR